MFCSFLIHSSLIYLWVFFFCFLCSVGVVKDGSST